MSKKLLRSTENSQETAKQKSVKVDTSADLRNSALSKQQMNAVPETAPGLKIFNNKDGFGVEIDHPDQQIGRRVLMDAMGTGSVDFCNGLLPQLVRAASHDVADQTETNFLLSVITSKNPDGHFVTMGKALMAASFNAAMDCHSKALRACSPAQLDSASRAARQFEKSYMDMWDTLDRHQGRGVSTVNVETVNVSQGSQAIVGNVIKPETPHLHDTKTAPSTLALPDQRIEPMPIINEKEKEGASLVRIRLNRFRPR